MPGWLQPFARNQPASVVINAVRALLEGPLSPDLWEAVAWCLGILTVFFVVGIEPLPQGGRVARSDPDKPTTVGRAPETQASA